MKIFNRFAGWVARSKTQQKHTDALEMLGFLLWETLRERGSTQPTPTP